MKKIVLCALLMSFFIGSHAQVVKKEVKNELIDAEFQRLVEKGSLTADQANSYMITAQHTSKTSGIEHIYFSQAINGLLVNGTESSIHLSNGKKIKYNEKLILGDSFRVNGSSSPSITAENAIRSISQIMGYKISNLKEIERKSSSNQETIFNSGGISKKNIQSKLAYQLTENNEIKLVWEVTIEDINSTEDWWVFAVNASNGSIISKYNLYNNCNILDEHNNHFHSGVSHEIEKITKEKIDYSSILKGTENNDNNIVAGTYNVYAMPDESPLHGSVGRTSVSNPEGAGSPFGWHDTNGVAGAESNLTTGNNVDAHKGGFRPDGGGGLVFNYSINLATEVPTDYVDVATTNLFYWSSIIHDVFWVYGFDEAARNFQENNYGNGGSGSDSVDANCQASGNCNANFGTPGDGSNPTMNMFICDIANPDRDGDFDNGVIIHEYGHGISNRLTGGASVSCLQNSEQMGEGWGDFFGLVMTMQAGDSGTDARGIGTYLLGQSANGAGIRVNPYSTDMSIYTQTYANVNGAVIPHGVGEIWANMLWEMTWGLIADHGVDTDIYNFTGNVNLDKGNVMALALATEGMKLQPCSPGFQDGRDAILAADVAIYGGANACIIWEAFAKRGLGFSASQGSSSSTTDQTVAFDLPPNTALFSSTLSSICETQGTQTGLSGGSPAGGTYSGSGVTDNGDGTFDFDPTVGGTGNTIVTYTVFDDCSGAVVALDETIVVTDGLPVLVCQDVTVILDGGGNATINDSDVIANLTPGAGYTVDQLGTYAPIDISTGSTDLSLADDAGSVVSLGFTFTFFQIGYSTVYVTSNGYLTFDTDDLTDFSPDTLPSATLPDNIIAAVWDDLNPSDGGTIRYKLTGTSPDQIMVVDYIDVPHYISGGGSTDLVTTQIQLYEGSGRIEIHTSRADSDGGSRTQGIENTDGSEAYTASGRNNANWNLANGSSDYVAFVPNPGGLPNNCGLTVTASLSLSAFTCKNIGDVVVTVTADDGNGGITTCDATVTVIGTTSTFDSGSWDVTPNIFSKALFSDDFNTSTDNDVTACSCEIESGNTVTVNTGGFISVRGDILVDGTLLIENGGSLVQVDDDAIVTNNGSITVEKTTPSLTDRDFTILGSPMTLETTGGVYTGVAQVRYHDTGLFIPHPQVAIDFPLAENFADDNGDNWQMHTGALTVGEGYLVKPYTVGSGTTAPYTTNYTLGTLNTGVVNFITIFGDDQNDSPNILSNPYASAVDAFVFVTDNAIVDAIYYWEHINAPDSDYPGYNASNYDMGDISMYNLGGGVAAANNGGGTQASNQYIPSGQGFAIKANAAGTVTFNNSMRVTGDNTGYRNNETIDRLYLSVVNNTYGLKSGALIAFTELASDGYDRNYDAKRLATPVSVYSLNSGRELGIQGRSSFNEDQIIPLGFSTQVEEDQEYTISISSIEGEELSQATVYLKDYYLNTLTNLFETDYRFTANVGHQTDRFVIVFTADVLGTNDLAIESISLYPNPTQNIINIVSPQAEITSVEVFDVRGRLIDNATIDYKRTYQLDMSVLESAMYFVRIHTAYGSITKRIVKE